MLKRVKFVSFFDLSIVAMIALSRFIVVANDSFSWPPIEKRILQPVRPLFRRGGETPDSDLYDRSIRPFELEVFDERCWRHHM